MCISSHTTISPLNLQTITAQMPSIQKFQQLVHFRLLAADYGSIFCKQGAEL